mmetsp:Transcript_18331/g.29047  ORF Transcript_18331/g.29047 Transcript_18331/m.29047 type:complete len:394 (-) Transcript_18331:451-1632(-)
MGACSSHKVRDAVTASIDQELNNNKSNHSKHKKILFLGSGGSGKSTVFKQLRNIHGSGCSAVDRELCIPYIHAQVVNEMKFALNVYMLYNQRKQQLEKKSMNGDDEADEDDDLTFYDRIVLSSPPIAADNEAVNILLQYEHKKNKTELDATVVSAIQSLWSEAVMKEIYELRHLTRIETSSAHFWNKLDEITDASYLPSDEDMLLNRHVTTSVQEMQLQIQNDIFQIIDVGGQRSQRRKWIHCFEHVVAVIFVADMSCYDEVMVEDIEANAMQDQCLLFNDLCNNVSLAKTTMIVFLNKRDLFKEKYVDKKVSLTVCPQFSDFCDDGDDDFNYEKAAPYVQNAFLQLNETPDREVFMHVTCATDKDNIQKVFTDVQLVIISNALDRSGYLNFE